MSSYDLQLDKKIELDLIEPAEEQQRKIHAGKLP
jgi:hypothetical protein